MTRPWTPDRSNADGSTTITTKRACNGCGEALGDATAEETSRVLAGLGLPDVRKECPNCGPGAPEPACRPVTVLVGEQACLDVDCDHEHSAEGGPDPVEDSYCDEVEEQVICSTHSTFTGGGFDYEEASHAEPWPCQHSPAVTA